jgi:hypothetical protein
MSQQALVLAGCRSPPILCIILPFFSYQVKGKDESFAEISSLFGRRVNPG